MTLVGAAAALVAEADALPVRNTASLRTLRRRRSREWRAEPPAFIIDVARKLAEAGRYRWLGMELVRFHPPAFRLVDDVLLSSLSERLDSWGDVDAFGRILAGPAWALGRASDGLIRTWQRSPNRWRRRLALVATIALDDRARALKICAALAGDRDDMVVKALSWALRERAKRDPAAVRTFLDAHESSLAAWVKREVRNKLATGLKQPRRRHKSAVAQRLPRS